MYKHIFTPIAHRGGSEVAFENTYEAFADAYELGYRWLETDVQISKDGVLYAHHDTNLKRLVGINVNVHDLNSEDLDHILITDELYNNHDTTYTIFAENFFSRWSEYDEIISDHRPVGIRLMFESD